MRPADGELELAAELWRNFRLKHRNSVEFPAAAQTRRIELAPANWKKTLPQRESQEKLDANIARRFLLSPLS